MPFCKHCGSPLDENTVFCSKCGTRVSGNTAQVNQPVQNKPKTKSGSGKAIAIVCGIIGFIILIVVICLVLLMNKSVNKDSFLNKQTTYSSFIDSRDGQEYKTVKINNQTWMAQNLNYASPGSYCDSCELYGRLYSYTEASCPSGWVLPSYNDIKALLQVPSTQLISKKLSGTDNIAFSSVLNGFLSIKDQSHKRRNEIAGYWVADATDTLAIRMKIDAGEGKVAASGLSQNYKFSVRCISQESTDRSASNLMIDPRDGKIYKTVTIGKQTWMAQNLNYKSKDSQIADASDPDGEKYGRVYPSYSDPTKRYCPKGWHLPKVSEWEKLFKVVGNKRKCENFGYEGETGYECDYHSWSKASLLKSTEIGGSDTYGMGLLLGGAGNWGFGDQGNYWADNTRDNVLCILKNHDTFSDYCTQDGIMTSVRCVKN